MLSSSTLDFDLRSIDAARLLERRHRITRRSSDNLPGGLSLRSNPRRGSRLAAVLPLHHPSSYHVVKGEKRTPPRTARQAFPDNFESRWLPQRAMISTWMGRLRLQQSELPPLSHSLSLSLSLSLLSRQGEVRL